MLARIRKSMKEKDQGFTLIELLVVMIIIGILAAIAIPVFLNQRKKAVDSGIKSDLRTVANAMETQFTDTQAYIFTTDSTPAANTVTISGTNTAKVTLGNVISAKPADATGATTAGSATAWAAAVGYCLTGENAKATGKFYYNSVTGGMTTTAC